MGASQLTDSPGSKRVIVELVDIFIFLPQGLEGVFILIQRAVLQGLGRARKGGGGEISTGFPPHGTLPSSPHKPLREPHRPPDPRRPVLPQASAYPNTPGVGVGRGGEGGRRAGFRPGAPPPHPGPRLPPSPCSPQTPSPFTWYRNMAAAAAPTARRLRAARSGPGPRRACAGAGA